jgi:hypothetical protein
VVSEATALPHPHLHSRIPPIAIPTASSSYPSKNDYQNRLTQSAIGNGHATTTTSYAYGPFGERVSQTTASSTTIYPNKFYSITTFNNGTTTATSTDYVFAGSNLLATIDQALVNGTATGTPITRYNHTDNLGSTNVTSDSSDGTSTSRPPAAQLILGDARQQHPESRKSASHTGEGRSLDTQVARRALPRRPYGCSWLRVDGVDPALP